MNYTLKTTAIFNKWLNKIKDKSILSRLDARLLRVCKGNFGDYKLLSPNLYELRCFFGGGLRIYYTLRNGEIVLLLCGGDKSSQSTDIEQAKKLLNQLNED